MNNLTGKVLGNRYILLEKIGEGGMALVYKARCQLLNRYVAVKILKSEFTTDDEFIKKFKRESLAAASLSHPNIVGIYDVGEQDGIYYIVMEYIQGQTLKDYIKKMPRLSYEEALKIIYQIALALDHAHRNGVVHRDIKPHNILITDEKIVKVTDFGIARAASSVTMTNTGTVMGSVHYFSPEQARGGFVDLRTDIYSLGVVMYELLTGALPYDAESPVTVALKHIQDSPVEPLHVDSSIPRAVNDIVLEAMEKDMTKRYQTVREMIDDINEALNNPEKELRHHDISNDTTRVIPIGEINEALEKDKTVKKKRIWPKILITVLGLVILTGLFIYGYSKLFIVKEVAIPKIVGLQEDEAQRVLKENKLNMEVSNESSEKPLGEVIKVIPDEGYMVKENFTVNVVVSSGPNMVDVPDLKNLDIYQAESVLKQKNLKRGSIDEKYSDTVPSGFIIEQTPGPGGERVPENTEVNFTISKGPEIKMTTVPLLIGDTLADAQEKLKKSNLNLGSYTYDSNPKYINDVIIDQDIPVGTEVKAGNIINVTINKVDGSQNSGNNQE